ncbi:DUF58 domain-containing protein [Pseudokineococcus lusitanus]|uniref:DUF58 domain-containing protein n=1 Tax=Pseudokineococcus lusitanus TaxID=763993 RepID=UPI0011CD57B5|nr:DUF58 domain-containing protein [Pseudokineococcus lusitanus]
MGPAVCLVGALVGQRDVVRLGALLVVLLLVGLVAASVPRPALVVDRVVGPSVVPLGGRTSVRLDLHGAGRGLLGRPGRRLLAEDVVPSALRPAARFVVAALPPGASASVRYAVPGTVRGRHEVGPLRITAQDPFGLVLRTRSTRAVDVLLVVPAVVPLPAPARPGAGTGGVAALASPGEDDVVLRDYRPGDDRRRVHWRASARRGELVVRREDAPRRAGAVVLLDAAAGAVLGPDDAVGLEAFERAVTAVASAGEALATEGLTVRLVTADEGRDPAPAGTRGRAARLERLAAARPGSLHHPHPRPLVEGEERDQGLGVVRRAVPREDERVLVVVTGAEDVADRLRALGNAGRPALRLVLVVARDGAPGRLTDVPDGAAAGPGTSTDATTAPVADDHAAAVAAVAAARAAGWGAAVLGPDDDLVTAWQRARRAGSAGPSVARPAAAGVAP